MSDLAKRLEIKAAGLAIPKGSTTNATACPWCQQAGSFSITHTHQGDVLFLCHRAKCGEAGYIKDRGVRGPATVERVFTPRVLDIDTQGLDNAWYSKLLDTYRLTREELDWAGWRISVPQDRLVIPVYSPYGAHRGHVARGMGRHQGPKSLTYREVDDVWMGWYIRPEAREAKNKTGTYGTVVVVEDLVSALKASRFYPAAAICGTYISNDMLGEILQQSDHVVLSLDADATQKAFDYAKKFAIYGNFRTVPLSKDVKNMNDAELKEWSERL